MRTPEEIPEPTGKFRVARKGQFYICKFSSRHLEDCEIAITVN